MSNCKHQPCIHVRSVQRHVPEDADLVVLEFALNDKNATQAMVWHGDPCQVCALGPRTPDTGEFLEAP